MTCLTNETGTIVGVEHLLVWLPHAEPNGMLDPLRDSRANNARSPKVRSAFIYGNAMRVRGAMALVHFMRALCGIGKGQSSAPRLHRLDPSAS